MKYLLPIVVIVIVAQFAGHKIADQVELGASAIVKELKRENRF